MILQITPAGPSLTISPGGQGPIVSLKMTPNSAPSPIADAPVETAPENTDLILMARAGALVTAPFPAIVAGAATQAASAAVAAVGAALSGITQALATDASEITANAAAIVAEATRAEGAENALTTTQETQGTAIAANATAIGAEATRAEAAEAALSGAQSTQGAEITANASAISAETTRAEAAEAALASAAGMGSTANATAIAAENARAEAAEAALATTQATQGTAITANAAAIGAETTRAEAAEAALAGTQATHTTEITASAVAIAAETARAEAAEAALAGASGTTNTANALAIVAETTRAEAAEAALAGTQTTQGTAITANAAAIGAEATRAEAAESALAGTQATQGTAIVAAAANAANALVLAETALTPPSPMALITPGGFGTAPGGLTSNVPLIALLGTGSARLYASFQNSATEDCRLPGAGVARPTTGIFASIEHYTQAVNTGQIASGAAHIIDPALIWQAAANWCSSTNNNPLSSQATKVQVLFHEHGYYPNWSQAVIPDAGEVYFASLTGQVMVWFECPYDTKIHGYGYGLQDGMIINQTQQPANGAVLCKNVRLNGYGLCKPFTKAVNLLTGEFATNYEDHFTATAGDWTGLTPQFTWQVSANPLALAAMLAGGTTVYCDALPPGMTLAQIQALIAANTQYGVGGFNITYLGVGCTIASVAASTLPGYAGYQVVFNPPANPDAQYSGGPLQAAIPAPKAAQLDTPAQSAAAGSPASPELIAEPAIPSPTIIFYTGQGPHIWNGQPVSGPYFARGHAHWLVCENLIFDRLATKGFSQGQSFANVIGNGYLNLHPRSFCNDGRQDTGAERVQGGRGTTLSPRYSTGDQCLQPQTAVNISNGALKGWSNLDLAWDIYDPDCFCFNAAPFAVASNVADRAQSFQAVANGAVTVNTSTTSFAAGAFDSNLPLTGAGSMAAAAVAGFAFYNAGYTGSTSSLVYLGCPAGLIPGSFVIGYTDSGGSVGAAGTSGTCSGVGPYSVITALPQGSTAAGCWRRSLTSPNIQISNGIPVGILLSYNRSRVFGGTLRGGGITSVVTMHNGDNQMNNECELWGTTIDGWFLSGRNGVCINMNGGDFGGCSLRAYGIKAINGGVGAFSSNGVIPDLVFDEACLFGQAQNGRVPGYSVPVQPTVYATGAQNARIKGVIQASVGGSGLQVGDINTSLSISTPSPNASHGATVGKVRIDYCQDGEYAVVVANSNYVCFDGLDLNQATLLGSGAAMGISLAGNTTTKPTQAPQGARIMSLNASNMDGAMIAAGNGATYYTGSDLIAGTAGLPALQPSPSLLATITAALAGLQNS